MTPLLTTATHPTGDSHSALILLGIILAAGYILARVIWPFRACRNCHGTGGHRSPTGRAWRPCRTCQGSGARLRTGRRIWTYLTRTRNDADRHNKER